MKTSQIFIIYFFYFIDKNVLQEMKMAKKNIYFTEKGLGWTSSIDFFKTVKSLHKLSILQFFRAKIGFFFQHEVLTAQGGYYEKMIFI